MRRNRKGGFGKNAQRYRSATDGESAYLRARHVLIAARPSASVGSRHVRPGKVAEVATLSDCAKADRVEEETLQIPASVQANANQRSVQRAWRTRDFLEAREARLTLQISRPAGLEPATNPLRRRVLYPPELRALVIDILCLAEYLLANVREASRASPLIGRADRDRTCALRVPNAALYLAELPPVTPSNS